MAMLRCPNCGEVSEMKTVDSRSTSSSRSIRRRRVCAGCGERFTTYEMREAAHEMELSLSGGGAYNHFFGVNSFSCATRRGKRSELSTA